MPRQRGWVDYTHCVVAMPLYPCINVLTHYAHACTAGIVVPTFQPASSLTFFQRFLAAEPFAGGPDGDDDKEL
jgi:putative effector of murein hydrolase